MAKETKKRKRGGTLLEKLRDHLRGGQFRMLNEKLYTSTGDEAFELFQADQNAFVKYHTGYREQTSHWPVLPADVIIEWLREKEREKGRKRRDGEKRGELVVADFGCGDAKIARSLSLSRVFSIDLVSNSGRERDGENGKRTGVEIISCNMAHTPLRSSSVDVSVFCLSLMGKDYPSFLREGRRVTREGGWLVIAEVKSRFWDNEGENKGEEEGVEKEGFLHGRTRGGERGRGEEGSANGKFGAKIGMKRELEVDASFSSSPSFSPSLSKFLRCLRGIGFELKRMDDSNTMFFLLFLKKEILVPPLRLEVDRNKARGSMMQKTSEVKRAEVSGSAENGSKRKGKDSANGAILTTKGGEVDEMEHWPELKACIYKRR